MNFAKSNRGIQLNFLLHHDFTSYKLVNNFIDLTPAQIYFQYICAKKQQDEIDKIVNQNKYNTTDSPLILKGDENPEDIKDSLKLMKEVLWQ